MSHTHVVDGYDLDPDLRRIERFTIRARRIQAHSLCQDFEQLVTYADNTQFVDRGEGGEFFAKQALPDEERLESLATRIRPLLLHDDGIWSWPALVDTVF